jgi:hypothetical protein
MSAGLRIASPLILVLAAGTALAQQRGWTDPPAQIPPPPPPVVEPAPTPAPAPAPAAPAPRVETAPPAAAPPVRQAEPTAPARPREAAPAVREAAPTVREAPVPRTREAEQAPPSRPRETEQARPRETAPAEAAPPVRQARPRRTPSAPAQVAGRQAQERAAENLALDYLDAWSESNSAALDLTRDFYGSRVLFHGREMSTSALFEEKRRFARRWPERSYQATPASVQTDCNGRDLCTVRAGFEFMAVNPETGRRSAGRGTLQLIVSFAGERPLIVGENSWVGRLDRNESVSLEDLSD